MKKYRGDRLELRDGILVEMEDYPSLGKTQLNQIQGLLDMEQWYQVTVLVDTEDEVDDIIQCL